MSKNWVEFSLGVMGAQRSPRTCPACGHHFIPWNIWRVSIYTPIRCPNCDAKLIRRRDLQFFLAPLIVVCVFGATFLLHWHPRAFGICATLVLVLVVWPVDAFTVRLVEASSWRGWFRGYGNRDAITRFDPIFLALAFICFSVAIYYFIHS